MKHPPLHLPDQTGISPPTTLPFKVRFHGRLRGNPYHSTRGTHHGDLMLTLVVSGKGTYSRGDLSIDVGAGMMGLVHPGDDPGILFANPKDPYDHYSCRFSGTEAVKMAGRISSRHADQPFFDYPGWQPLAEAFERLIGCTRGNVEENRLTPADTMLGHILSLIEFYDEKDSEVRLDADTITRYLREHISSPIDLGTVARYFGISKEHLCRCAKPLLGKTVHGKWVELKMDWAKVLLRDSTFPVKDVARRVGYAHPLYFSNVFRKHCGCSPGAFRHRGPEATRKLP